jgi:hypothetical protein
MIIKKDWDLIWSNNDFYSLHPIHLIKIELQQLLISTGEIQKICLW